MKMEDRKNQEKRTRWEMDDGEDDDDDREERKKVHRSPTPASSMGQPDGRKRGKVKLKREEEMEAIKKDQ